MIAAKGQSQTDYGFYPIDIGSAAVSDGLSNRFKCIDEPFEIYGDYVSDRSSNLMLVYELCDISKRSTCKSNEEIQDALEFAYILILENAEEYRPDAFPGST